MSAALLVRTLLWLWFGGAVAAGHWLVLQRLPPLAFASLMLALAALPILAVRRLPLLREWFDNIDDRTLVVLHVVRLVGIYFLWLHREGDLPRAFVLPGGIGETIIAVMGLPVALAPLAPESRQRAIRIWSIVGCINLLLLAFTLTRLSLSYPLQVRAFSVLPLSLYPTFLLPLLLATQVLLLVRTAPARTE